MIIVLKKVDTSLAVSAALTALSIKLFWIANSVKDCANCNLDVSLICIYFSPFFLYSDAGTSCKESIGEDGK